MFNVKHNECVGFESRWKVKKVSSVGATQTSEFSTSSMETSTSEKKDVGVQAKPELPPSTPEVDEEKLAEWMNRIYPQVKRELEKASTSKAFKGYRLVNDAADATCQLTQSVDVSSQVKESDIGSRISALSWNSTNKTLAVSCIYKHKSWCYHEGFITFFTLNSEDSLADLPKMKLKTDSCVVCLEFHPVFPAVIAAGLYSGGIVIWNTQKEEEEIVAKIHGHSDGITHLSWPKDINSPNKFLLATSSLDGFLNIWNFALNEALLIIKEKHQIKSPLLPKSTEMEDPKKIRGIVSFDFSKHFPEKFVVGVEGGMVVECSLLGTTKMRGSTEEAPILDSAFKYYESHKGEIISVSYSPNRKDMFMTYGSDSEIRFYMIGQEEPAKIIFLKNSLNCVAWIPFEEQIIAGCGSGCLEIFTIVKGKLLENTTKEKIGTQALTCIQINKIKTGIVAVGTEDGKIQMWRVPWALFGNL